MMEATKVRVTQSDIARVAGVHNTTVSLALRNCPAIPETTRRRIQAVAEKMGYYPDPALRALVAYRRGLRSNVRQQTVAYVTNWDTRWGWRDAPAQARFYAGAQRKAAQFGYLIEHFWLGEPGMTQPRLSNVLFHRGITGVILAAHRADSNEVIEFDWARLSAVKIGCFPHLPSLHRVVDDQGGGVRLAMRQALAAGYERIGLVMPRSWDDLVDQAWSTVSLAAQSRLAASQRVPILLYQDRLEGPASSFGVHSKIVDLPLLHRWYTHYRPDVVLAFSPSIGAQLRELGLSIPDTVAYADLVLDEGEQHGAGVRQNSERVGEIATEMVVGLMQQNICGIPEVPTATLVEGSWVEGESLPTRRGRSARTSPDPLVDPDCVLTRSA